MNLSRWNLTAICLVGCCLVSSVMAQEGTGRNPNYQAKEGDRVSSVGIISPQENDQRIARWLMPDVIGIIECSKVAQERSTNENVKQFAQAMVTEHNACLDKMHSISKSTIKGADNDRPKNPPIARAENAEVDPKKAGILVKDDVNQPRGGKMIYRATDFVQVKEDICNQMKAMMSKEMKALSGTEFDRAYMKHMVVGHEMMLASCKAVRKTASTELQGTLDQNIEKLTAHAKQAKQLCDQVCGVTTTGSLNAKPSKSNVR